MASGEALRAVNRLIAAAIAHREALRTGQGPSRQGEFVAAVDRYLGARNELDQARDDYLIRYPTADALTGAVACPDGRPVWPGPGLACPQHQGGCPMP